MTELGHRENGLTRLQIRRALNIWTLEGSVATVFGTLTGGAFQTGFAIYLGCSVIAFGWLGAIPAFAGLIQLVSSYWASHSGDRKRIVIVCGVIGRFLWLPMLLIPFVLPRGAWVAAFLILTAISSVILNIGAPLWMAWITDLVPGDNRGRYFGRKNMIAGVVGTVVSIVAAGILDILTRRKGSDERGAFALIFGISLIFAVWSYVLGKASPDVAGAGRAADDAPREKLSAYLSVPFADKNFRRIIAFAVMVVLSQAISGQFFAVYQLETLSLGYTWFQILNAVASLSSLAVMPLWGYLGDKYGNKPILAISGGLVFLPPLMWMLTAPGQDVYLLRGIIIALNLLAGAGWAGVGLTQFNLMIGAAPPERRAAYVSAIAAASGLAGGVAPLLGGVILQALGSVAFSPNSLLFSTRYHVLFLLSAILRGVFLLFLRPIHEADSSGTRYVLGQLKASKPVGSIASLQKLSRGASAASRQQAAEELGRLKTPVAVEELVKALDDVALPVREQAAVALGEIGDARATASLVKKLTDPASGIEGVAATALGKIGSKDALPSLAAAAQLGPASRQLAAVEALGKLTDGRVTQVLTALVPDADLSVRIAAIRALAEREDPESAPTLIAQLKTERDPATLAVLADALGRLSEAASVAPLLAALERTSSPTVRRELLNAVGSALGGRDAFYPYLALEGFARDETVSKVLTSLQRRQRARASRERNTHLARLAVRARQALAAYAASDYALCTSRLAQLGCALTSDAADPRCVTLQSLDSSARPISVEETLLAVFLVRLLSDATPEKTPPP